MAQSTEDYLDSLLRQAMGIPDPESEKKPDDMPELGRDDVLAMAEGLTGSNSAILGNAYDHNASFTNEGEIEIPVSQTAPTPAVNTVQPAAEEDVVPIVATEDMPDPDAPVASAFSHAEADVLEPATVAASDMSMFTENLLPDIDVPSAEPVSEPAEPVGEIQTESVSAIETEPVSIPDGPVIEHDGNLDIIPEPENVSQEMFLGDLPLQEAIVEPPAVEEPVIEEPVIEEPVIGEPVVEKPVIEEPVIEEPVVEEPVIEEPVIEEPVIEEPAIEEPVIEEPAIEEPVIEEPAIEEPQAESPEEEELGTEGLELLDIPAEDAEEAPLMPDQEISDLLSTLGEITGENEEISEELQEEAGEITLDEPEEPAELPAKEPEEPAEVPSDEAVEDIADESAGEEITDETAVSDDASSGEAADTDGIDMFDTDLSAMLDDVTSTLDTSAYGEGQDDADLNDLLGALDDGSGELSDIGDLLNKDENSELVDPNTETAEALFASDSEEDLFNIDNPIEEEESGGRKKKKKKFGLFGKKKKKDSDIEIIGGDEEILIDPDLLDIPEEQPKEKKVGFFAALLAKLFEEIDEGDEGAGGIEQSAVDIAQEGAAENEAILSELETEEALAEKKKGKKEKKKKEKKDKKDKKDKKSGGEEGEEGEEAADEGKKKKKKEKKKKEKLPEPPSRKLPRKKVVAIVLFCLTIGIVVTLLAFFLPYSQDIKKAKKFYATGEYQKTYEYMRGHKLTEEDKVLYNRTMTLLRIKRPYDSYQNYMKMGLRMEALNALVQGVQMSDRYAEDAASLGITDKYSKQSRLIYDELYNTFGVTVERARSWIQLEGSPEYTRALYEALLGSSQAGQVTEDDGTDTGEEISGNEYPDLFGESDDSVINAEENDL